MAWIGGPWKWETEIDLADWRNEKLTPGYDSMSLILYGDWGRATLQCCGTYQDATVPNVGVQ